MSPITLLLRVWVTVFWIACFLGIGESLYDFVFHRTTWAIKYGDVSLYKLNQALFSGHEKMKQEEHRRWRMEQAIKKLRER